MSNENLKLEEEQENIRHSELRTQSIVLKRPDNEHLTGLPIATGMIDRRGYSASLISFLPVFPTVHPSASIKNWVKALLIILFFADLFHIYSTSNSIPFKKSNTPYINMTARNGVQNLSDVQVGKPYRGVMVRKIDVETIDLKNGKVKIHRTISMDGGITVTESTFHDHEEVYEDGKQLPLDKIKFPSDHPPDFKSPPPYNDEERLHKRELLRQRAREMMNERRQ